MLSPLPGDIFRTGQVLNNTYEIEGILGRGGTGEVYRARNQINDRVVALKALNREFSQDDSYLELMKREEEMRSILHPAVVRYSDNSRSDDGHVFLVMDYVEGPSLNDRLSRGGMDARDLLVVAHRVAEGLVATHRHNIVHRDLSPDNIILRGGDPAEAVIIDFGIAKDTSFGAKTIVGNDFAGKYEYAAPEQIEGRAEPRSDLYALGAALLATHRGEIPFQRATPGEIVRRKQSPLDTSGIPEPLKGVLDWLTAPRAEDRPASAAEVVGRLEQVLKLPAKAERATGTKPGGGRRRRLWPMALAVLAALGLGGAWLGGALDAILPPSVPTLDSYRLSAASDGRFSATAPDEDAAAALRGAYSLLTGQLAPDGAVEIGLGMPSEGWIDAGAALLGALAELDEWRIDVRDLRGNVEGKAPDSATRDSVEAALRQIASAQGFQLSLSIEAAIAPLPRDTVQRALSGLADCGPLAQGDGADPYPPGAGVTVTGNVQTDATIAAIRQRLGEILEGRPLVLDTPVLNRDVCAIRDLLPAAASGDISIRFANGVTGEVNLTGIFTTGQNPLLDILVPASVQQGSLWVMIVDNSGKVFHAVPNINRPVTDITQLGVVEGGVRRIRVLHAIEEFSRDNSLLAMRVNDGEYGKSEVVAILSDAPLFDDLRPREESTSAVIEALSQRIERGGRGIRAIATRIIEARP